jgi:hypothetical protein
MGMRCKLLFYLSRAPRECRFSFPVNAPARHLRSLQTAAPAARGGLLRAVAVYDFHVVAGVAKVFADFLGDHDGAVLAAGASERDG